MDELAHRDDPVSLMVEELKHPCVQGGGVQWYRPKPSARANGGTCAELGTKL
jgi:hypothetical protein